MKSNSVLMYSGGLDSLIGYYYIKQAEGVAPKLVYSCMAHRYESKEIEAIRDIEILTNGKIRPLFDQTVHLGPWEQANANIPMRNMFLAMLGAYYADRVYLVCQKGEQDIPDRGPKFFEEASKMISFLNGRDIEVLPTFPDMTKTDMVKWYIDNGHPIHVLKSSISCYDPHGGKCGMCSSCFRRWVAMSINGIEEDYVNNPWEWTGVSDYIERIRTGKIDPSRVWDIKKALAMKGVIV